MTSGDDEKPTVFEEADNLLDVLFDKLGKLQQRLDRAVELEQLIEAMLPIVQLLAASPAALSEGPSDELWAGWSRTLLRTWEKIEQTERDRLLEMARAHARRNE